MPNWCCAAFNVTGDEVEMDRFFQTMFRTVEADSLAKRIGLSEMVILDFNGIIPMPSEPPEGHEAWALKHWGTKWNAHTRSFDRPNGTSLRFQFDTPWTFPTPVFDALAAAFPGLVFSGSAYEDSGAFEMTGEFNGEDSWGPGEIHWADPCETDDDPDE